jgi:hypothetical protein
LAKRRAPPPSSLSDPDGAGSGTWSGDGVSEEGDEGNDSTLGPCDSKLEHNASKKAKHNVSERRRTSRLNNLFEQLNALLMSRPDLCGASCARNSKADVLINSIKSLNTLFKRVDAYQQGTPPPQSYSYRTLGAVSGGATGAVGTTGGVAQPNLTTQTSQYAVGAYMPSSLAPG